MTNLVGAVSDSVRFQLRGAEIPYTGVTYTTRAAAEEAASVFRDHLIDAEVVPVDNPKFPTPWRADDGGYVYDANGVRVAVTVLMDTAGFAGDLARLIVEAVNEKYGKA